MNNNLGSAIIDWKVTFHSSLSGFKPDNPVLVEGLPGIGNVGKIVVDFLVEKTNAELFASFFSYSLPNSVFVNEDNLVDLPKIEVYYAVVGDKNFFFLTGDVQPVDEVASYLFCESVIKNVVARFGVQKIITLGGVGLPEKPSDPVVYVTGNDKSFINDFVLLGANPEVYGVVGPIIGVSGLLLGLGAEQGVPAVALLAETFGHPMHVGVVSAKLLLRMLISLFGFDISDGVINAELPDDVDSDDSSSHGKALDNINKLRQYKKDFSKDINYIG